MVTNVVFTVENNEFTNNKRRSDKRRKRQTSEATNVGSNKRRKRQTSEATNVRGDKRRNVRRRKICDKHRKRQTSEKSVKFCTGSYQWKHFLIDLSNLIDGS